MSYLNGHTFLLHWQEANCRHTNDDQLLALGPCSSIVIRHLGSGMLEHRIRNHSEALAKEWLMGEQGREIDCDYRHLVAKHPRFHCKGIAKVIHVVGNLSGIPACLMSILDRVLKRSGNYENQYFKSEFSIDHYCITCLLLRLLNSFRVFRTLLHITFQRLGHKCACAKWMAVVGHKAAELSITLFVRVNL